ncbi:glycyl-radical enzyme activating protein [Anaerospora hongkongensis]|uniref:glycyl-radical enzyme activating protein n=1 Tax=Anaerospora hongkongensis TaxID=244830 RepID=UPI00289A86BD|nr:glycyl-radical enzyme activating protein [Anaerospora hongkongensis]
MKQCSGTIFQIQRWSIHDGDGVRSTVFLKGCPLRCQWCANPESWKSSPEVVFFEEKCIGCNRCLTVCKEGAITKGDAFPSFDRDKCRCGSRCCEVCPAGARKLIGSVVTVDEVLAVIKRDTVFYRESGGGVTFSGGEPFAQPEFLRKLVTACSRLGINTAVETSGYFDWEQVDDIFEMLDCVFIDIKHMDDVRHREMTGVGNDKILENIARISRAHPYTVVRVPLISEVNANEQNIHMMCEFIKSRTDVKGVELLPYHDFGESKYRAVGAQAGKFTTPEAATINNLKKIITDYNIPVVDFK